MPRSQPVDGFSLTFDRHGEGAPVVLLHGWPGMRTDYRALVPLLGEFDVVVPDLRGFGESDKHVADPAEQYSAAAQARSVAGLLGELGLERATVAGYDVGSRVAQAPTCATSGTTGAARTSPSTTRSSTGSSSTTGCRARSSPRSTGTARAPEAWP
ncbi:MAG TPA: alpha/beta fold hydrolase [Solirubrobacteraceae bacterium]|nr:alpha/beta fold hydrolase [Solirubrobacteraceae bacterium]